MFVLLILMSRVLRDGDDYVQHYHGQNQDCCEKQHPSPEPRSLLEFPVSESRVESLKHQFEEVPVVRHIVEDYIQALDTRVDQEVEEKEVEEGEDVDQHLLQHPLKVPQVVEDPELEYRAQTDCEQKDLVDVQ